MKKLVILLLALSVSSVIAQGKGKDSQLERAVNDEVRDELLDIDDRDNRGSGKPNNPGAKGRANAEYKKATNPGQGGGKGSSLEGALLDEILDDDDQGGKKDGNKKGGKNRRW